MKLFLKMICLAGVLLCMNVALQAQITAQDAITKIKRGINIGNSLDANPTETSWGNPLIQKYYFDDYANAGFTSIRIPITWKDHILNTSPFTIDQVWLNRVDSIVTWGLNKGLYIIINIHHEEGLKQIDTMTNLVAKATMIAKYDSLWSQIATHFKDRSDHLFFELLNEPQILTKETVDAFNVRELAIVRKTNPTRIVIFSGTAYTGADNLIAASIPDTNDNYLMAYFHSYDPWAFAGQAIGTYGSSADISNTAAMFTKVAQWSKTHNVPVILDEFGTIGTCDYNSRMIYYATVVEKALNNSIAVNAWDDNGNFQAYIRNSRTWNDLKDVIIHTYKESPTQLKTIVVDTTITLSWTNRTTLNDSIYIDRRTTNTAFSQIGKISPTTTQFKDSALETNTMYYYRIRTNLLDSIDLYSYPTSVKTIGIRKPFLGSPVAIPGTIEAENFDIGGEGQTFHDNSASNLGKAYRLNEAVDIEARSDNGYQIGYVANGEWTQYSVHVKQAGLYRIDTYTASTNGGGKYYFSIGKVTTGYITVPKTADSSTLAVSYSFRVALDSGAQILTFKIIATAATTFTIDKFVFTQDSSLTDSKLIETNGFNVFPNPAHSKITIRKSESETESILSIYNYLGIKVKSEMLTNGESSLSLEDIPQGNYVFVLTSKNGSVSKKVFIEK
jgi:aryl-phospho-beta-D-glucosidase BglC (GH1 family)